MSEFELKIEKEGNTIRFEALHGENLICRSEIEVRDSQGVLTAVQGFATVVREFERGVNEWLLNKPIPKAP